ncbi:hypothetical protein WJ69_23165 [Burkholderia ubonensis]|uniref:hypothetical protein n=1 Tax=Burkholderia ubonensis TaxID=101571 RepID=UPI000759510B|nr:hypothetical protein [Burkholderia ubonensis]KVO05603.1 hypothetical protein WJ69_23165 [Burkholderia ubonensis]
MTISIIQPRRPRGSGWQEEPPPRAAVTLGFPGAAWFHSETSLYVISAVEVAAPEGGVDKGPEYHLSISRQPAGRPARCSTADALFVLAAFELLEAEEDNHVPHGVVRNFWRPVADKLVGLECACKADEPAIVEDKGEYVWRGVTR